MESTTRQTLRRENPLRSWEYAVGVVYLFQCKNTSVYKIGGTTSPRHRFAGLASAGRESGLQLRHVWSIITNGVGRLEECWMDEWRHLRTLNEKFKRRFEWFDLPASEVSRFRSFSTVNWKKRKAVPTKLFDALQSTLKNNSRNWVDNG